MNRTQSQRQIILDTETTGLDPKNGNRLVEIGCVEMISRRLTGNHFHYYLNPERDSEEGALRVHGLTREFLNDKPLFSSIAEDFLAYIAGAELVIHNAPFDLGFLNHELALLGKAPVQTVCPSIIDTLVMAKDLHPGKRNNLDALCDRYEIDNSSRVLHGALLDAEILAEVYLAMTRGQDSLLDEPNALKKQATQNTLPRIKRTDIDLLELVATPSEVENHLAYLAGIEKKNKKPTLWQTLMGVEQS